METKDDGKKGFLDNLAEKLYVGVKTAEKIVCEGCEKMDKKLEGYGEKVEQKIEQLEQKYADYEEKFDGAFQDPLFKIFYKGAARAAGKGKDAIKGQLEQLADSYSERLDQMVAEKPKTVGFIDGFTQVYTNNNVNRSKKHDYKEGIGIGKAIGWGSSVGFFLTGGLLLTAASAIPAWTRRKPVTDYLKKKAEEVKQEIIEEEQLGKEE